MINIILFFDDCHGNRNYTRIILSCQIEAFRLYKILKI